ncbi:MAG TPA: polysaccharide deacetylase family protein [Flavipsychrobacter sp.]|jgi:peptidoglycan/xylan/chitin deacetylase (PgdA/CDA1 family)|nr:polysaccharide deacetylase family protein [Flavipsychrobacter sp.]
MRTYSVKTPSWLPRFFPKELIWKIPVVDNTIYLTFDDGPNPIATPFVLDVLKQFDVKATFFCIGKNIEAHPEIYQRILDENHVVGNHTYQHYNGWKTNNHQYLKSIFKTQQLIEHKLFRPPYGRIKISQAKKLVERGWKIIMWDVLSGDFDTTLDSTTCINNVLSNIEQGSIIVFHDSEKAFPRMKEALPDVVAYCKEQGFKMAPLPTNTIKQVS